MAKIDTVKVMRDGVEVTINKCDLDKEPKTEKPKAKKKASKKGK